MLLNRNTSLPTNSENPAVQYALRALRRDMDQVLLPSEEDGGDILLRSAPQPSAEGYCICAQGNRLTIDASDALGFVYALFEISRRWLQIQPFWFWNDQTIPHRIAVEIPEGTVLRSKAAAVKYRGWFVNDETLLLHWTVQRSEALVWQMVFEALLRCGGNMVIPGTGGTARRWSNLAADMGLILTQHHAEPLGAEMFAHAYPQLEPSFAQHPEMFRSLWRRAVLAQHGKRVIWNIGFRGQGDRPFWEDDPQYDTPAKRGALISQLLREQYDLVKQQNPDAVLCTNLYGEILALYRKGYLQIPADVIKIWADNGYGKMVSRRQGNENPRLPALPGADQQGPHGIYYHASFYDLQAASHITALPNSAEFVAEELAQVLRHGAGEYWLVNCSNVKPHAYLLDMISQIWQTGAVEVAEHRQQYAQAYYGPGDTQAVERCLADYPKAAIPYGPHPDDHAGDQYFNHLPRVLMSQFMANRSQPAQEALWAVPQTTLREQVAAQYGSYADARPGYESYLAQCEAACAGLKGSARRFFKDSLLLQAQLYRLWCHGAELICRSLLAAFGHDEKRAFYLAGKAQQCYTLANRAMRDREHGKWVGFYANECQTDVKQTAYVCGMLMSYLRNLGDGPHFYQWMREFCDSEENRRVMLLLNTENHPTDEELFLCMEQWWGE